MEKFQGDTIKINGREGLQTGGGEPRAGNSAAPEATTVSPSVSQDPLVCEVPSVTLPGTKVLLKVLFS